MEIERANVHVAQRPFPWKIVLIITGIVVLIGLVVGLVIYFTGKSKSHPPSPSPPPVFDPSAALIASDGSTRIDSFPYLANKSTNPSFDDTNYEDFFKTTFTNRTKLPCKDPKRDLLLSYISAVYYNINTDFLQLLTTDELLVFYRSLVFYFITVPDKQPDGGWYGDYWGGRIIDDGPVHNRKTGETNMTIKKDESFLFDQVMLKSHYIDDCPAYQKTKGKCPTHAKFWGNRLFPEMSQASIRRGMRNSPQLLAENPPWAKDGKPNPRYGLGGYPSNVYLEMLQFPQEHSAGGWPTGCDATKSVCDIVSTKSSRVENFQYQGSDPRYQPNGKNREAGATLTVV